MSTETKYLVSTNTSHDLENSLLDQFELLSKEDARHRMVKFGGLQPDKPSQELTMYEITITKVNPHPNFRPHRKVGHQLCELYLKSWEDVVKLPSNKAQYDCKLLEEIREILETHGFTEKEFNEISAATGAKHYMVWYKIYQRIVKGEDDKIFQWSKFWA